jgi:hypothetical protein
MEPYTFNLTAAIENLSNVPSDLHHFFAKTDDGYRVAENFTGAAKRMNGLSSNLEETRAARTTAGQDAGKAREKYKSLASLFSGVEGIDGDDPVTAVKTHLETLAASAKGGGKKAEEARAEIEQIKSEMAKSHAAALEGKDQVIAGKDGQITKLVKTAGIASALSDHTLVGSGELLRTYLDSRIVVKESDDGTPYAAVLDNDGKSVRFNGEGNPMSISQFVTGLKEQDDFKPFFGAEKKQGSGTPPGTKQSASQQSADKDATPLNKISAGLAALHGR